MNTIKALVFVIMLGNLLIVSSCNGISTSTTSDASSDNIAVDSSEIKKDIEKKEIQKLMTIESIDYFFDSLDFKYSLDADSILNKKVLIYDSYIGDVYKDEKGYHVFLSVGIDNYIRLTCTKEQAELITNDQRKRDVYNLTFIPNYIRKINLELVANAELEGEDQIESYITIDEIFSNSHIIEGSLIKITPSTVND